MTLCVHGLVQADWEKCEQAKIRSSCTVPMSGLKFTADFKSVAMRTRTRSRGVGRERNKRRRERERKREEGG